MLFENFVSLIDGQLANEPSIASFTKVVFDAKKIKRGDLYLGDFKDIDEALKNGAYGIVSTKFKVKDKEIAWIKVKNLHDAKLKLLRYLVIKSDAYTIYLTPPQEKIAKAIQTDKVYYIDSDIDGAIKDLEQKEVEKLIVFCDEKIYQKLELPSFKVMIKTKLNIIKSTTFLTTFLYNQTQHRDIKLPELFMDDLEKVANLFDELKVGYSFEKLHFISHFKPLFLDSRYELLSFGQSTKVVILEHSLEFLYQELEYLKQKASWAKVLLLAHHDIKLSKKLDIDIKYFKTFGDIEKLGIFNYNFVIMTDVEKGYEKYLQKKSKQIKNRLF